MYIGKWWNHDIAAVKICARPSQNILLNHARCAQRNDLFVSQGQQLFLKVFRNASCCSSQMDRSSRAHQVCASPACLS
jgi:hypothetical protein